MKQNSSNKNNYYYLVLDLGTTAVKGFVFDKDLNIVAKEQQGMEKMEDGVLVEQNPQEMMIVSINVLKAVVKKSKVPLESLAAFGISTQRETTILWDKETGKPIHPAIVWQDSRTSAFCESLRSKNKSVVGKTGLPISPYFSASKIKYILDTVKSSGKLIKNNALAFGTPDSWLLWNFSSDHIHATDLTNASRTLLFNIKTRKWDKKLLELFEVDERILPDVKPSSYFFGMLIESIIGVELPILAMCGDQQASMFAAGSEVGSTKITFGTGTFLMQISGEKFQVVPPFFTTLSASGNKFAVEEKIDIGSKEVTPNLGKPEKMKKIIQEIVAETVDSIKLLPHKPEKIIVDGGISQSPFLIPALEKETKILIEPQKTYDGTALGVAKLIDSYFKHV